MERESPDERYRLMRAIRSLAYNRELQPLVDARIERAESRIRGYLLTRDLPAVRLGAYLVEMDEAGDLRLSRLSVDEWQQMMLLNLEDPASVPGPEEGGE
jgi:hypothetical protein